MSTKTTAKKATKKPKAATNGAGQELPFELKAGMLVGYSMVEGRLPVGLVIEPTEFAGVVRLVEETKQERKKRLAETRRLTLEVFQRTYEQHQKNYAERKLTDAPVHLRHVGHHCQKHT